ncbi:MAG: helix-turn-helix transcriptional regulator [Lachnospiraceae bacterium]|nr:helix-turn-helix transcriptional regulator [Lachnospiraceae bacterium]
MFKREIGKRIRQIREEKEMTRDQLAANAEITSKFLYELENGKKGLSATTLLKVANALSCSCDYILLGVKSGDGSYGSEPFVTQLLKGFNEKQCKIISEILQLLLELNEEMTKHEL